MPEKLVSILKTTGLLLFCFGLYFLTAKLGLEIATINKQASPVWPATGIAMGLMWLFGPKVAFSIFLGALLSNFQTGLPLPASAAIAAGNTLESLFFYIALTRILSRDFAYGVPGRAIFGIFVMIVSTAISASVGTATLYFSEITPGQEILTTWITWWVGDFLGALFIVPLFIKAKASHFDCFKLNSTELLKLAFVSVIGLGLLNFIYTSQIGNSLIFVIFLVLLIAGNWLDSIWVYMLSIAIGVFSVWQTILGNGPFAGLHLNDSLVHLQIFLAGLSLTAIGITSLKQDGFRRGSNIALLVGWVLSGMTFYILHQASIREEEALFANESQKAESALAERMEDYIQMLESGVSYFNASDYVSAHEWEVFSKKLLSTDKYPGIEGLGVIFSSTIKDRFAGKNSNVIKYQPTSKFKTVPNLNEQNQITNLTENFIITYIEPLGPNQLAVGLNVASERKRFIAASRARDTGMPAITDEIQLVQDSTSRPGFLMYIPFYKSSKKLDSVQERRAAFIGFIYSPVVLEKFIHSAVQNFQFQFDVKISDYHENKETEIFKVGDWSGVSKAAQSTISFGGKSFYLYLKKSKNFSTSKIFVSSWIGFFGTLVSVLLAITLASLQNISIKAESLATKMTKELNERKRIWQALTETSPVGIYTTDSQGAYTYANPAWIKMTGLTSAQALGNGWMKAVHPDDLELVSENWQNLVQGKLFSCNYRFVREDQAIVHVTGQAKALMDENDQVVGYFGTVQDVTEIHLNQMALLTASRMSSLGQMASGIAHEINNPLTIIQGKAIYLEKMLASGGEIDINKAKTHTSQIQMTVMRIAKIVRGLQSLARETTQDPQERVSIKRVFDETLEMCRERFHNHGIALAFPSVEDLQVDFYGRSEQIAQVLLNLLNNAHDAAIESNDKWVKIDVKQENDKIRICISDSGSGIPSHLQNKVFDPFFTTKPVGVGTGLGLSISKGIVRRHNGQLFLDSSKSYTAFVLEIPIFQKKTSAA